MPALKNSSPRSVAELRLLYFGTGGWRHEFLDGRATADGHCEKTSVMTRRWKTSGRITS